ncbi:MAG: UDP-N-acetylmuramoyl-L-alanine--D-glutamate ligase [Betaproteobacteria bacterium]|nr:UDP-N-acetylmuramoyl-L-alanine--D-glutamate ligase [Betaproteobacteria bacterium]
MNAQHAQPLSPHSQQGRRALVVGLGDTGASCVRWLIEHDAQVRATDTRAAPPHAQHLSEAFPEVQLTLGGFNADDFAWADLIVVSPGVPVATPEIQAAQAQGKDIVGDVELFARAIAGSGAKVIAITGSNGKSTVTSLAHHLCAAAGFDAVMAGNIGLPVLDALDNRETAGGDPDVWVLELSSFQLETTHSLHADAATVLNVSEDHLDRYDGMAGYIAAKARVFAGNGAQILNRDDPVVRAMALPGRTVTTFGLPPSPAGGRAGDEGAASAVAASQALLPHPNPPPGGEGAFGLLPHQGGVWLALGDKPLYAVDQLPIAGLHNAANVLAALALCQAIGIPLARLLPGLASFRGLPHRVEPVDEVHGRTFFDDSKGTNVGATVAALLGFARPVVLIAGGDGKGQDFTPLREAVKNARAVVQIGRDGPRIEAAIAGACPVLREESMEQAVWRAYEASQPGDVILMSPACASFDMFRNYAHRAEVFIAAVKVLAAHGGERRMNKDRRHAEEERRRGRDVP